MPIYTVVQPFDPSSMYAEKFLVSLPVLLTLMTSLVFVVSYAVCWILELLEGPEPPSAETQPWRGGTSDDEEAEIMMYSQEQEHEDGREVRVSSTGKQQQQRSWKADLIAGRGFHVVGNNPGRSYLVTSAGLTDDDDDDVTAIPTRTLPNISVEVTVAFGQGGEKWGAGRRAAVKRSEEFGHRQCFGRCPCDGGGAGLSQDVRGTEAFAAELERSLRRISTLQLCRQATELESVVGQVRTLVARLRTTTEESTIGHHGCRRCDESAERFSVREDPDPEEFSLPEHRNSCCGNDDDDNDRCCSGRRIPRDRKPGQCTCRMEPEGSDAGQPASHRASEQETTQSQVSDVNRDRITGGEATDSSKAVQPHTSRSFTLHVTTGTGNRPESSNPYDPVSY